MTKDKSIQIRNIYYMLSYAFRNFRLNDFEEISGEDFKDAHNLLAEILVRGMSDQLKRGLYKTYVNREGALPVIRGKIDFMKTRILQRTQPYNVYCGYDDLSENNIYNQIIKTTLQILLRCTNVEEIRKDAIRTLLRYFESIDALDCSVFSLNQFVFDRNNQNYQFLINVCWFVIHELLLTTEEGIYRLKTLTDDHMERLFEKFVLEYYKRHYPKLNPRAEQIDWDIDQEKTSISILPRMQTDVMLTIDNRTLIIDTKYYDNPFQYHFDTEKIRNLHIYQIKNYVTEYDKEHTGLVDGLLLYAKPINGRILNEQMKMRAGNTIYFRTLDLNQDFKEIEGQLAELIQLGRTNQ